MNQEPSPKTSLRNLLQNWLSLSGLAVMVASMFSFLLLFAFELFTGTGNPYLGLFTYLVAPSFFFLGLGLAILGAYLQHRRLLQSGASGLPMRLDLTNPVERRKLIIFGSSLLVFLLVSAFGSYQTYHFSESVVFCGQICHEVMKPERVTYLHSPHARVSCTDCHIGSGATWFVKAKLSGAYQVYATLANKYPRPVPTPIANLRPAQDTCEKCHWPRRFSGNLERTFNHVLTDETNSTHTIRMLLRVGGGDSANGPVGGIHWHMNIANKIEYVATDRERLKIPWVRMTSADGKVTEFRTKDFTNNPAESNIRRMDCVDCHNRPAHIYKKPNDAVELALNLGQVDRTLPYFKTNAASLLVLPYKTEAEALQTIASEMARRYPNHPGVKQATEVVQKIYQENFFPHMQASWKNYPEHIGHKDWPGCTRCHDDNHKTADGKQTISFKNCNACHIILAQGQGKDLEKLSPVGQEFKHPGEDWDPAFKCNDCHTGGP